MNIGIVGASYLQTTHQGHSAQGLQPNSTPVSQTESLTRVNSSQNIASTENKPNSQHDNTSKNPEQVGIKQDTYFKNTKEYKQQDEKDPEEENKETRAGEEAEAEKTADNPQGMTEEELKQVKEMTKRDQEVRTHEAAHLAAAGQHAKGGIHLDMKQGPDGKSYAVGGHVSIDTSPVPNDPQATMRKARQIRAAALAPRDPSSADRSIASEATQMAAEAQAEILKKRQEQASGENDTSKQEAQNQETQVKNSAAQAYETVAGIGTSPQTQNDSFYQIV